MLHSLNSSLGRGRGHRISRATTRSNGKRSKAVPSQAGYASFSTLAHFHSFTSPVSDPSLGLDSTPHTSWLLFQSRWSPSLRAPEATSGILLLSAESSSRYMVTHSPGTIKTVLPKQLSPDTTWPVFLAHQSVSNRLKHVPLCDFISLPRFDNRRFGIFAVHTTMRSGERRTRIGRAALFPERQRHAPILHFIPEVITSDLAFTRNLLEIMYFRDLVRTIHNMSNATAGVPASFHISDFERPFDDLYWCDLARPGPEASDEGHARRRPAATCTLHSYHNVELFSQTHQVRKTHLVRQSNWWRQLEVSQCLCVPTAPVLT